MSMTSVLQTIIENQNLQSPVFHMKVNGAKLTPKMI